MDTHHPAIAAAEEAARDAMDRWDAEVVRPALAELAKLKRFPLSPWVMGALVEGLLELAGNLPEEPRDCAKGYLGDCADDMKGFHRDRC